MAKRVGGPHQRVHGASSITGGGSSGTPFIPDKLYFRIGEVAALCRVPTYVLRFWQTEFPQLRPGKSGTGQRLYRKRDVEMALRIKRLLHDEGYTIVGAKGVLADEAALHAHLRLQPEPPPPATENASGERARAQLQQVRGELREVLGLMDPRSSSPSDTQRPALLRKNPAEKDSQ